MHSQVVLFRFCLAICHSFVLKCFVFCFVWLGTCLPQKGHQHKDTMTLNKKMIVCQGGSVACSFLNTGLDMHKSVFLVTQFRKIDVLDGKWAGMSRNHMVMSLRDAKQFKTIPVTPWFFLGEAHSWRLINVAAVPEKLLGPPWPGEDPRRRWGDWFSTTFASSGNVEITQCCMVTRVRFDFLYNWCFNSQVPTEGRWPKWNQQVDRVWFDVACSSKPRHIMMHSKTLWSNIVYGPDVCGVLVNVTNISYKRL